MVDHQAGCGCCGGGAVVAPAVSQTLEEVGFSRGLGAAASAGDVAKVKRLLKGGADPNGSGGGGHTPLHYAALAGHADICRALLAAGADPNARTAAGGATPLHRAALKGHAECLPYNPHKSAVL
eukprot:jgi/Chlat1/1125/Chrsp111S08642